MNKLILLSLVALVSPFCMAQKAERDYIRRGNKNFKDSTFIKAEVNYRKAIDENPQSTIAMNNLGNTLTQQSKFEEAMEQYVTAIKIEKDKDRLAEIYHNMGVIFQAAEDYHKAIEAYKFSLRNNPNDHETRYNLALAQKMLKEQEQDQEDGGDDDNQDQQQDQEEQQDQNQDNQENKPQQPPQSDEDEMSKENAEQLLNAILQDEKDIQDKVQKQQQVIQGGQLDKNW